MSGSNLITPSGIIPPLHALRAFEAVGRLGSVTAAAEELCVTQSAVSHQLRQLETALDLKMFERRGRSLTLTSNGRDYFSAVAQALTLIRDRTTTLRSNAERDTVTISTLPSFGIHWLIPRLNRFRAQRPSINVHIRYSLTGEPGRSDAADLQIRYGDGCWPDYESRQLLQTGLIVVCSENYLTENGPFRTPEDLNTQVLIHDENLHYWQEWLRAAEVPEVELGTELIMQDQHMVLSAAIAGQGIALCRLALAEKFLKSGALIRLFEASIDGDNGYFVCWREGITLSPSSKLFRNWMIHETRSEASEPL